MLHSLLIACARVAWGLRVFSAVVVAGVAYARKLFTFFASVASAAPVLRSLCFRVAFVFANDGVLRGFLIGVTIVVALDAAQGCCPSSSQS